MTTLLTIPDVAERLRLSRSKVYDLINNGKLKMIKIDNSSRITEEALDDYLEMVGTADGNSQK